MNVLFVPTLALDITLLDRLAASVDYHIPQKVVWNNGGVGRLWLWQQNHPDWRVLDSGANIGCAGAWNMAPSLYPNEHCWLISNDDQVFQPGCLEKLCRQSDLVAHVEPIVFLNEHRAFDCFVWTKLGLQDFGTFDENFWPAYYEDWEYRLRLNLKCAGRFHIGWTNVKHGKPHPAGENYTSLINGCGIYNREYFMRKWGCIGPDVNKVTLQAPSWTLDKEGRRKRWDIWETFLSMPNPSIYT